MKSISEASAIPCLSSGCLQYTAWSKAFKGTLDYIFHTSESLVPVSTLELPDDSEMSRHNGMPNESWSSDHIALMAEFQYVQS